MTRSIIGGIVAIVIAALTATAYFVTTSRLDTYARGEADARVQRATKILKQQLEGLVVLKKAESLANNQHLLNALRQSDDHVVRRLEANRAWADFKPPAGQKAEKLDSPDILALVDINGDLLAQDGLDNPIATTFKNQSGQPLFPALQYLTKAPYKRLTISEIWNFGKGANGGLMRVGIGSIIDPEQPGDPKSNPDNVKGFVVVAYAVDARDARDKAALLGTDVAYYDKTDVFATSFHPEGNDQSEDTGMQQELASEMASSGLGPSGAQGEVRVGGKKYLAQSLALANFFSKPLTDYPFTGTAGAVVLTPPADVGGGVVKIFILVLGLGALGVALFGMYTSNHRILYQVDQIELGVADIINGNLDRTFRPVGDELEGLSNGLNVMLARLLGRPEPGEEEFDDDGNPIVQGRVEFEEAEENAPAPAPDPDLAALAQEPEPDYYKRVFTEYVEGRKSIGHPDEVSFENFIAKLRVNEGKLKGQYNCKAVRFRVVVKDGKVTLKPVPIFG